MTQIADETCDTSEFMKAYATAELGTPKVERGDFCHFWLDVEEGDEDDPKQLPQRTFHHFDSRTADWLRNDVEQSWVVG
jgi:hypothetical protein